MRRGRQFSPSLLSAKINLGNKLLIFKHTKNNEPSRPSTFQALSVFNSASKITEKQDYDWRVSVHCFYVKLMTKVHDEVKKYQLALLMGNYLEHDMQMIWLVQHLGYHEYFSNILRKNKRNQYSKHTRRSISIEIIVNMKACIDFYTNWQIFV